MKILQKEQNSTNLLLWPPIWRNKSAITPKWFNSLDTNSRVMSENVSYTRYTRAFCQVGLPSTLATAFWTKSKNIQQKGASRVITKRPAHICQIPATIHNGERLMQHQKPKNTATRMREKKWIRIGRLDFINLLMYVYYLDNI